MKDNTATKKIATLYSKLIKYSSHAYLLEGLTYCIEHPTDGGVHWPETRGYLIELAVNEIFRRMHSAQ